MLGFLKKNKKKNGGGKKEHIDAEVPASSEKKATDTKRFPLKRIVIILLVLVAVGASGFVVYKFWFSGESTQDKAPVYKKVSLMHVGLPDEMLKFSFEHFPELYSAFVAFNQEIILFDREIERIEKVAETYPEQKTIADKEKKSWEKARETLKKSFIKIEKPVKETYVLFRVNKEQGLLQIRERNKDLVDAAQSALAPAQEMTRKLKELEKVPDGLIKGTIYKLKKKFL